MCTRGKVADNLQSIGCHICDQMLPGGVAEGGWVERGRRETGDQTLLRGVAEVRDGMGRGNSGWVT